MARFRERGYEIKATPPRELGPDSCEHSQRLARLQTLRIRGNADRQGMPSDWAGDGGAISTVGVGYAEGTEGPESIKTSVAGDAAEVTN